MVAYGIEDVPHTTLTSDQLARLKNHDGEQASLMAESIIAVDEWDNVIGPMSKIHAHQGPGAFHRAFSLLVFDSKKQPSINPARTSGRSILGKPSTRREISVAISKAASASEGLKGY